MSPELEDACVNMKRAVEFYDRVKASSERDKTAVGTDHWDWLLRAARKVAELTPEPK